MSREDDGLCKRCGRLSHDIVHAETGHAGHHRFEPRETDRPRGHVSWCRRIHAGDCEPASAEVPQGETVHVTTSETRAGARYAVPREDLERIDAQVRAGIEPAAQPETGDVWAEAEVAAAKEHAKRYDQFFKKPETEDEGLGCMPTSTMNGAGILGRCYDVRDAELIREAYDAGLKRGRAAATPRCVGCGQVHEPCSLCPSGLCSVHQPVEGMIENLGRELATAVVFIADNCAGDAAAALVKDLSGYQVVADAIAARRGGKNMSNDEVRARNVGVTQADNDAFGALARYVPDVDAMPGPVKDMIVQALANHRAAENEACEKLAERHAKDWFDRGCPKEGRACWMLSDALSAARRGGGR